jgi:hypothetical protein
MKIHLKTCLVIVALGFLTVHSHAQIVVTYEGYSEDSTMPGSSTDFVFFNQNTYPQSGPNTDNNGTDGYSKLNSFSIAGGVGGYGYVSDNTITTPAGDSLFTGDVQADGSLAFGVEPGSNSSFNYDDFNIYIMYANTGLLEDTSIGLYSRSSGTNGSATVTLDGGAAPSDFNLD